MAHRPWTRLRPSLRVGAWLGRAIDITAGTATMDRDKPTDETGGVEAVGSSVRRSAGRTNSDRDPIPADRCTRPSLRLALGDVASLAEWMRTQVHARGGLRAAP
jgi:hypothetical protein